VGLGSSCILANDAEGKPEAVLPLSGAQRQRNVALTGSDRCTAAVEIGAAAPTSVPPRQHDLLHGNFALVAQGHQDGPQQEDPFS